MTTAETLRAEGRTQGRAEGRTQGRAEGRTQGRAEALVQVLTVKFGSLPESVSQTVHRASSDQLQTWTARAVTAETLDQVFD